MRLAFCAVCQREVHLTEDEPLRCPVCSSPLLETGADTPGDLHWVNHL